MQKDTAAMSLQGYREVLAAAEPGLDVAGLALQPG